MNLRARFTHDGRCLVELCRGNGTVVAFAESHVDDLEGMTAQVVEWCREWPLRAEPGVEQLRRYSSGLHVPFGNPPAPLDRDRGGTLQRLNSQVAAIFPGEGPRADDIDTGRFADELATAVRRTFYGYQRFARERSAGGEYLIVLRHYLRVMQSKVELEDQDYHPSLAYGIGGIVDQEEYLAIAEDDDTRALHQAIQRERTALYNWYMDLAKGGVAITRRPDKQMSPDEQLRAAREGRPIR